MSNISKRRREGSRSKIKSMGDHKEFLNRITKTLYYGELPSLPCLSLPVTEVSCALWSAAQQGRSLRRLHVNETARFAYYAGVSPCALVLALVYLERLRHRNPEYVAAAAPSDLFLASPACRLHMVGNKFLQDDGVDAETRVSEWAAAAGIEPADLKRLEIDFLDAIEWNVYVNDESFESGLSWLESQVALKQAKERGFFTYSDLAAAGGDAGAAVAGRLAAAVALAYVAALGALVASALLVSYTLPLLHLTHTALLAATQPPCARTHAHPPSPPHEPTFNTTVEFSAPPRCCTDWLNYHATLDSPPAYPMDYRPWFDIETDFTWYRSSLVDPLQRWLERLDEYADEYIFKSKPEPRCVRQWLNLSRLGGLAVVSDR
ncbi:protein CNPPD1 [Leguminivora glycinivorella]|uniref:protein CNPPD1 n=1 Tax=Leguminivora glycinivorella TaxID=1035111 RepID=UPI00200FE1A9|nr:protein CNPPD1 [Leguminivora glycinivorella]